MPTLSQSFERDLKESIMDNAEEQLYGGRDNIAHQFLQTVTENFEDYANRHDYNLGNVIDSGRVTSTNRGQSSVSVELEWDHPAALFEYGTSPHKIEGNPILSFIWEDPPEWVKKAFPQGRTSGGRFVSGWRVFFPSVQHPGMPEARAIRGALNQFRFEAQGGRIQL